MFSIDTETGFPDAVLINGAWGLGESVVSGTVDPDEFVASTSRGSTTTPVEPIISKRLGRKSTKIVYASGDAGPTEMLETSEQERSRYVI